jgi:hypothetical protein
VRPDRDVRQPLRRAADRPAHRRPLGDDLRCGAAETIRDATATGFLFDDESADGLLEGVYRALALYRRPLVWRQLQLHGMGRDFSWATSARKYLEVYSGLVGEPADTLLPEALSPATYARPASRAAELRA